MNVFITADIPWIQYNRQDKKPASKVDIFRYQLTSYSMLPFEKAYIYKEFDDGYDISSLSTILYPFEVVEHNYRNKNIVEWRNSIDNDLKDLDPRTPVWLACNHDHPFVGNNLNLVQKIDSLFYSNDDIYKSMIYSHWSEFLREAVYWGYRKEMDGFISYQAPSPNTHSVQVVSVALLREWFFGSTVAEDVYLPRSDWWYGKDAQHGSPILHSPPYRTFVPLDELCRHFDGYSHIGVPDMALEVPEDYGASLTFKGDRRHIITSAFRAYGFPTCPEEFI